MRALPIESGIPALDELLGGLWLGDNVVWQVDDLNTYALMARAFAERALASGRRLVYLRFASHPPLLEPDPRLLWIEVDASSGFEHFTAQIHQIVEEQGLEVFYVFDSLSSLVADWGTDELLANFFRVTCPFLRELDTVAYFVLARGQHSHRVVARIRDTTQLLIDAYHAHGRLYIHPIKVFKRYSPQMFLPHVFAEGSLQPFFHSDEAAALPHPAGSHPLPLGAEPLAPWDSVYRRLMQYEEAELHSATADPEVAALKQELSRMIVADNPAFNALTDRYLTVADLLRLRSRLIGSGRIGGKAAGMVLARAVLLQHEGPVDFSQVLEEHDSYFIGSDVFFTFLVDNDLFRLRQQLTQSSQITLEEYEAIEQRFLEGQFPPEIMEQFRSLLDHFGEAPIIVRSSSLLEDSFGNAFAGKYRSEFCPNQGSPEARLEAFLRAVRLVYASAVNPDALSYRRRRSLGESDEQMAILVQRVSGTRYRDYFFPPLAGVAFSHNLYRWTERIDPNQGMLRMVVGLGTRAVNRDGGDYPRMVALSHPELRPEAGDEIAVYSQRTMDVLDLTHNTLVSLPVSVVTAGNDYPNLHLFASALQDGYVWDPVALGNDRAEDRVLTFNRLLKSTDLVKIMRELLACLEQAYGCPVDTEFTAFPDRDGKVKINLLQCRPMELPGAIREVSVPQDIPPERILFRAKHAIPGGLVPNLRYLVYLDPDAYAEKASLDVMKSLGRLVGQINRHPQLAGYRLAMMGPGRWGSSNVLLGPNTTYDEINNAGVLVEIAREQSGQTPDLSYGTHFFQDLVEANIMYLPVFPADPATQFNHDFFAQAPSLLLDLLPNAQSFAEFIKVIDVPAAAEGNFVQVVADPRQHQALCYLGPEVEV